MKRRAVLTLPLLLAACATPPPRPALLPMLRPAPAALGRSLSLVQRLSVRRLDRPQAAPQTVEVLLEIDAQHLQLAGFALNQRVLLLQWDGLALNVQRHPLLPAEVDVERMLRDIGLAWWPAAAVTAALPQGWTLAEGEGTRALRQGDRDRLTLRYDGDLAGSSTVELNNPTEGYALTIESKAQ